MIWEEGRAVTGRWAWCAWSSTTSCGTTSRGNRSIQGGRPGPADPLERPTPAGRSPWGQRPGGGRESEIVFLDVERILTVCPPPAPSTPGLIHNLVGVLAQKTVCSAARSTRSPSAPPHPRSSPICPGRPSGREQPAFAIPFDRQGLADYLAVDRSALSAELGKMRREGILDFHKNLFELKEEP